MRFPILLTHRLARPCGIPCVCTRFPYWSGVYTANYWFTFGSLCGGRAQAMSCKYVVIAFLTINKLIDFVLYKISFIKAWIELLFGKRFSKPSKIAELCIKSKWTPCFRMFSLSRFICFTNPRTQMFPQLCMGRTLKQLTFLAIELYNQ